MAGWSEWRVEGTEWRVSPGSERGGVRHWTVSGQIELMNWRCFRKSELMGEGKDGLGQGVNGRDI